MPVKAGYKAGTKIKFKAAGNGALASLLPRVSLG